MLANGFALYPLNIFGSSISVLLPQRKYVRSLFVTHLPSAPADGQGLRSSQAPVPLTAKEEKRETELRTCSNGEGLAQNCDHLNLLNIHKEIQAPGLL